MLKVVVDTNVFISGLWGGRNSAKIIKALNNNHFLLLISPELIKELSYTLLKPKFHKVITVSRARRFIAFIKSKARCITPSANITICRDPSDNMVLNCAISADADCIVSGDADLIVLHPHRNIDIISPAEFVKRLEK